MHTVKYWEWPEFSGYGRLEPVTAHPQDELQIDGIWSFQLLPSPLAPVGDQWQETAVPSLWTMQGVGDDPQYLNFRMPFAQQPPQVPVGNPTGVYQREFEVPAAWAGRRSVLRVGGFEGALSVEVNGALVGTAKDGRIAADFAISPYVRPGVNTLRLTVCKWSDSTFIEDQDQWWQAGISRGVTIYSTPLTYVSELLLTPDLVEASGHLRVRARLDFEDGLPSTGFRLRVAFPELGVSEMLPLSSGRPVAVEDPEDLQLLRQWFTSDFAPDGIPNRVQALARSVEPLRAGSIDVTLNVGSVKPWSAEMPMLYAATVELLDASGVVCETFACRLGFRHVEMADGKLLVNGAAIKLYGVNRHDVDPLTGRVLTAEQIREELLELKRWNINAIRTSHYPNDPTVLEVADELGFYVVAEANIEAHAFIHDLCNDTRYLPQFMDRIARLVHRDLGHCSVITWSLGNESGYGANQDAMAAWVRRFDGTRPIQYEGAIRGDWRGGHAATDIVCPMYPSIEAIQRYVDASHVDRPLIMCEYSHAMGNSNGSLADYWKVIEQYDRLQGGFIWELRDHALLQQVPGGTRRYAYGGDFGEADHDGNFCCDGLQLPDRTAKPVMHEVKAIGSPVAVTDLARDSRMLTIWNKQYFANTDAFALKWELLVDGVTMATDTLAMLNIGPRETGRLELPTAALAVPSTGEALLRLSVVSRHATKWNAAGSLIGWSEFALTVPTQPQWTVRPSSAVEIREDGSFAIEQVDWMPRLSFWRAPTDNDRIGGLAERWRQWGINVPVREIRDVERQPDGSMRIHSVWKLGSGASIGHQQLLMPVEDGVVVQEAVDLPAAFFDVARVGAVLEFPEADAVRWYGRGPNETYSDRRLAPIGRWHDAEWRDLHAYLKPQEHGGREDVRWMEIETPGRNWRVTNLAPTHVSYARYGDQELAAAEHLEELPASKRAVVHIDAAHRGLGSASCGPDTLVQYRVPTGTHTWTWALHARR